MGLTPSEFGQMRLNDFFLKLKGWVDYKQEQYQQTAELVRLQTIFLINVNLPRDSKIKTPGELWKFPWDSQETGEVQKPVADPEKMKQLLKAFKS